MTIDQFLWNAVVLRKSELHHHTNWRCWWEETVTALSDLQGCLNSQRPWLLFHQQGWMDEAGKLIKVTLDFFLSVDLYKWTGKIQCELAVNFYKQDTEFFFVTYEFCFLFLLYLKQWVRACLPRGPTAEWCCWFGTYSIFTWQSQWRNICGSNRLMQQWFPTAWLQCYRLWTSAWREHAKALPFMVDIRPLRVHSSWQEERSFPKPGPSLDKAGLERYS